MASIPIDDDGGTFGFNAESMPDVKWSIEDKHLDTKAEAVSPGNTALNISAPVGTEGLPDLFGVVTGTAIAPASSAASTAATADECEY